MSTLFNPLIRPVNADSGTVGDLLARLNDALGSKEGLNNEA
ncbi:hypothetical protein [Xanthomonas cissicola]|nr:hypothetical protein [Xanthomonas cissicola]